MRSAKTAYFFFFAAFAFLLPNLAIYYQEIGLTGAQIGLLAAIPPLVQMVASPAWGAIADATHKHKAVLLIGIFGALASVLVASQQSTFGGLALVILVYSISTAPLMPLTDNAVLANLGERSADYGRYRLWGAVGWGSFSPLAGVVIQQLGLGWMFWGFLIIFPCYLYSIIRLPVNIQKAEVQVWRGMGRLLKNPAWLIFLGVAMIFGLGFGILSTYFFLYMQDMGASRLVMGLAMTVATASEIPIFYYSDRLLKRWGARGVLMFSMAVFAGRLLLYSLTHSPFPALMLGLTHGIVFSAMWVAAVNLVNEMTPPELGATGQGLFNAAVSGLGWAAGGLLGGLLYESQGAWGMFLWAGVIVFGGLVLFAATAVGRARKTRTANLR